MAAGSLLALIDDIASVLDDVALMSKVAAKKTAGVLGDDLALNAQQVSGVNADRELPVVWAVALGSLQNKAILVPAALAISAFLPRAITPLLMVGGAYLCYEGFEKLAHKFLHSAAEDAAHEEELAQRAGDRRRHAGRRKGQDPGCDPHRFYFVGGDHRDRAGRGQRAGRLVRGPGRGAGRGGGRR